MSLLSFDTLKNFLDLDNPNKNSLDDYPKLKTLINEVQYSFETYCERSFKYEDFHIDTEWLHPLEDTIYLKNLPIKTVKSIVIDDEEITDFEIINLGIKVPFNSSNKIQKVVIKYIGGFSEIPEDIKRAARIQVIHEESRQNNLGASFISENSSQIRYPEFGLLKEVKNILSKYKNVGRFSL